MKLNKKMMTLALAGAMLTMTVCGAQAKELKGSMKNGAVAGLKNGMSNGMAGGMTNGLKNGMINGMVNGDVQQVLDAETLAKLLESGNLTQEEYDALIAALNSEAQADSATQNQTEQ